MTQFSENTNECAENITIGRAPLIYFVSGFLIICIQVFLLAMLKRSRHLASKGDRNASFVLVLPIYYLTVLYTIIVGIFVGIDDMMGFSIHNLYAFTIKWGLYRVVSEGLAAFLMHNGVGMRSVKNALVAGVTWSLVSTLTPLVFHAVYGWDAYFLCVLIFASCLLVFYSLLWLLPEDVIHRRPAMRSYARFFSISIIFLVLGLILLYYQHKAGVACIAESIFAMWDLFIPLIVFRTLVQDSQFWQGLYTQTKSNLNEPLLGMWEMGRDTIGTCTL